MEPSDLEKQLNELEEKIDRLRALYEQYFMGIERLEPLIPRKDVDRRITLLRKEQMRNTALRFRFNTLCQRYNTMQQHWGRVVREIENGTYRRDVARAAARFGVEDALTAVGKKRAAGLMKVLEAQKGVEARREAQKRKDSAEYEAIDAADLVEDDDDAPTPPPLDRGAGRQATGQQPVARAASGGGAGEAGYDAARFAAPRLDEAAGAERFGFAPPAAAPRAGADPSAMGFPEVAVPAAPVAYAGAATGGARLNPTQAAAPGVAAAGHGAPPGGEAAGDAPKKAPAGLRLGGGAARRASDPDAARRRLEELAASLGAAPPPEAAPGRSPTAEPQPRRRFDPDEIMSVGVPSSAPPPPRAAQPSQPERQAVLSPSEPSMDSSRRPAPAPLGLRPPSGRASSPALDGGGSAPQAAATPPPSGAHPATPGPGASAPSGPSAADRAAAKRAEVAAAAPARDLAEPRVREIYKEFIEAKRRSNESTASITYDKLADSLRKQVDKLKTEHRDRRIDFAVVTRDGKTMIKPIIK